MVALRTFETSTRWLTSQKTCRVIECEPPNVAWDATRHGSLRPSANTVPSSYVYFLLELTGRHETWYVYYVTRSHLTLELLNFLSGNLSSAGTSTLWATPDRRHLETQCSKICGLCVCVCGMLKVPARPCEMCIWLYSWWRWWPSWAGVLSSVWRWSCTCLRIPREIFLFIH